MDAPDQSYAAAASLSTIEGSLEDLKLVGFEPIVVSWQCCDLCSHLRTGPNLPVSCLSI